MAKDHIFLVIAIAWSVTMLGCARAGLAPSEKKVLEPSEIQTLSPPELEAADVASRYVEGKKLNRKYALGLQPIEETGAYWVVHFDDVEFRGTSYLGHGLTVYVNKSTMKIAWFLYNQ